MSIMVINGIESLGQRIKKYYKIAKKVCLTQLKMSWLTQREVMDSNPANDVRTFLAGDL